MTFTPVLPAPILLSVTVVLLAARLVALRRVLGHGSVLRWGGLTLAVLLLLLASFRPALGEGSSAPAESGPNGPTFNVFFVVDRSVDSRVEDFDGGKSRMAGIRDDLTVLVDRFPGARFAMISFSSSAELSSPLSEDIWSLKPVVAGLSAYTSAPPDAVYQVNAAAASDILRYKLLQAAQQYPRSANVVYYVGSGAGGSRVPQGKFDLGAANVAGGAVLGYGTVAGGPIPERLVDGTVFYALDAQSGERLNSAINEPGLTAIADQLGVPYLHRTGGQGVDVVIPHVAGPGDERIAASSGPAELYWILTLPAAVLLLLEIYLTIRQFRRHRGARRDVSQ